CPARACAKPPSEVAARVIGRQGQHLLERPMLDQLLIEPIVLILLVVAVLIVLFWWKPILLARIPVWIISRTFYRVHVLGRENVPHRGAALLVCNHVSYLDFVFLLAAQRRFIRFVIFAAWTRTWGLRHLLKWAG